MLSNKAKETISGSQAIQGKIADAFARTVFSVQRWIVTNNRLLETPTALQIIREETGMNDDEILVQEPTKA